MKTFMLDFTDQADAWIQNLFLVASCRFLGVSRESLSSGEKPQGTSNQHPATGSPQPVTAFLPADAVVLAVIRASAPHRAVPSIEQDRVDRTRGAVLERHHIS